MKAALVEVKTSNESLFGSLSRELDLKNVVSVQLNCSAKICTPS